MDAAVARPPGASGRSGARTPTIGKLLADAAAAHGGRPFLRFGDKTISYDEANRRADRVAGAFARLGIGRGDRVAVLAGNRPEYLDIWFGLAKLGAIELPINPAYLAPQITHTLARSNPALAIVEAEHLAKFLAAERVAGGRPILVLDDESGAHGTSYAAAVGAGGDVPFDAQFDDESAPIAIMNTSGTTGLSKGVLLPHAQQHSLGETMRRALDIRGSDVFYNNFPLFHNTAQAMIALPVLMAGATMVLVDKFSLSRFFDDVARHRVTLFYYIGEMLHLLARADADAGTLRAGWGIGATPEDMALFEQRFGVRLGTGYGSTEGNVPVVRPLGWRGPPNSVGRAIPGFRLRIVDEGGNGVPAGVVGEIVTRAELPARTMIGYDGDPAASAAALRDGWFHSGDAGVVDADGNLYFAGRIKDVIRVGGENVSGFEIEQALVSLDGVAEAAAIAVPGEIGGDDVKVVIVTADGVAIPPQSVIDHCNALLPRYAVPRYIEFVDALPKTETGKVRKAELRERGIGPAWDRKRAGDRR
jgi:crotonobetaine/carnitine-CoA ligase